MSSAEQAIFPPVPTGDRLLVLLGGQPAAGKTRAQAAILAEHQPEPSPWYRAPFGRLNKKMQAVLEEKGLTHVVSDAFANDTEIPDAEWVADFVLKNTKPGSILLIHMPERGRREWNFEAMRLTLEGLKERGLAVTTLSALLKG